MKKNRSLPIPAKRALHKLGSDINKARRRRRITIALMAERAGLSPATIGQIEKGAPTVSMSSYSTVLFVLGMLDRLSDLADGRHDVTGRELMDDNLPKRIRTPKARGGT